VTADQTTSTGACKGAPAHSSVGLIAAAILLAVVGRPAAGRVLRPLRRITATARRLSANDLDQWIGTGRGTS
jgi:HAMP domain